MVRKSGRRSGARRTGLVALLVIASTYAHAQVSTVISDRSLAVGERLVYTLTVDHEESDDITVSGFSFPGLRLLEGPSMRPITTAVPGGRERVVEVRYVFEAVTPGRYVLPAVPVSVAGQLYETTERLVEIGAARSRDVIPFLARWRGPDGALVTGQSAAFTLEIYNAREFLYPSAISLGSVQGAIIEEIQGLGSIGRREVDGVVLHSIPAAVYMVTVTGSGSVTLPAADIVAGTLSARAAPYPVAVGPAPATIDASGAVGSFGYQFAIDPMTVPVGETLRIEQRVSGVGNLHFLVLPDVRLSGFEIVQEETVPSLVPVHGGYSGGVVRSFVVRAQSSGPYRIESDPFTWYNPARGSTGRVPASVHAVEVTAGRSLIVDPADDRPAELLSRDAIASLHRDLWHANPLHFGWLVPGLLLFVATRLWRSKAVTLLVVCVSALVLTDAVASHLPWEEIDRGLAYYDDGDVEMAIYEFENASRHTDDSAGIQYNLAVLYFITGDTARSVYAVREAVRYAPRAAAPGQLLARIEELSGLGRSLPSPHLVHPNLFFVLLAVAANALFIARVILRRRRRGVLIIAQIVCVLALIASTAGLLVSASYHADQLAVVRSDYVMRRIPEAGSDGSLVVATGTAVRVVSQHGGYALVRTALELEGWIETAELLWPGNPELDLIRYRSAPDQTEGDIG